MARKKESPIVKQVRAAEKAGYSSYTPGRVEVRRDEEPEGSALSRAREIQAKLSGKPAGSYSNYQDSLQKRKNSQEYIQGQRDLYDRVFGHAEAQEEHGPVTLKEAKVQALDQKEVNAREKEDKEKKQSEAAKVWGWKYNQTLNNILEHNNRGNQGNVYGDYGEDLQNLLDDWDQIKGYAKYYGLDDSYYDNLRRFNEGLGVDQWITDVDNVVGTLNDYGSKLYGKWTDAVYKGNADKLQNVIDRWGDISEYADQYGLTDDVYNNLLDYQQRMGKFDSVADFNQAIAMGQKQQVGWGVWSDAPTDADSARARQDIYQANIARIEEIDGLLEDYNPEYNADTGAWEGTDDTSKQLLREKKALEYENTAYERMMMGADSAYAELDTEAMKRMPRADQGSGRGDRLDAFLNADQMTIDNATMLLSQQSVDDAGSYIGGMNQFDSLVAGLPEEQRAAAQSYMEGQMKAWDQLLPDDIQLYYGIQEQLGQDAADAWLDSMTSTLQKRAAEGMIADMEDLSGVGLAMANAASLITTQSGNWLSGMDDLAHMIAGQDINPYNRYHYASNLTNAVRGETQKQIEEWVDPEKHPTLAKLAGNTYQSIMSGLDSGLGGLLMGPFGGAYEISMSLGALSSRARELYEQGASKAEIAFGALGSAGLEALFEHVSLEHFTQSFMGEPVKGRNFLTKFFKTLGKGAVQGGVEASEEAFTELGNLAWDAIVRGYGSDNQQKIRQLVDAGKSEDEAKRIAAMDNVQDILWAAYGGFVSGAGMGAVGGAYDLTLNQYHQNQFENAMGENIIRNQSGQNLIDAAQGMQSVDQQLLALAQEKAGMTLEQYDAADRQQQKEARKTLGRLYSQTMANKAEQVGKAEKDTFRKAAEEKLTQKGVENAAQAADVLTKATYEGGLSAAESRIAENVGGAQMITEIQNSREFKDAANTETQNRIQNFENTRLQAAEESHPLNPRTVAQQKQMVADLAQEYSNPAEVTKVFRDGQDAAHFMQGYEAAYQMGQSGMDEGWALRSGKTWYLAEDQIRAAFEAGRKDAGYGTEENGSVRQSEKWNDRAYSDGEVRAVEEGTEGRAERGQGTAGQAETNADGRVSAKEMNIPGGTERRTFSVRDEAAYTESDREAVRIGKQYGVKCVIIQGGSIETDEEVKGKKYTIKARAAIVGDVMYIRGDDPNFASGQIAKHETGHKRIRNGEISLSSVRKNLREKYTDAQIDRIIALYDAAYGDTGMTDAEILEEIVCDSLGAMNAFATRATASVTGEVGLFLRDVQGAAMRSESGEAMESGTGTKYSRIIEKGIDRGSDSVENVDNQNHNGGKNNDDRRIRGVPERELDREAQREVNTGIAERAQRAKKWDELPERTRVKIAESVKKIAWASRNSEEIGLLARKIALDNYNEVTLKTLDAAYGEIAAEILNEARESIIIAELRSAKIFRDKATEVINAVVDGASPRRRSAKFSREMDTEYLELAKDPEKNGAQLQEMVDRAAEDIRYSREMQTVKDLQRENKLLRERMEYWKGQTRQTKQKTVREEDVRAIGKQILKAYGSKTKLDEILPEVRRLANIYAFEHNPTTFDRMIEGTRDLARTVLAGAGMEVGAENAEIHKQLKQYLRSTPIAVSQQIQDGIADYKDFKKRNRYNMRFKEDGTPVDVMWLELQDQFGTGMFPDDIMNPEDQLLYIADEVENLSTVIQNPFAQDMELSVEEIGHDIFQQIMKAELRANPPTKADIVAEKTRSKTEKAILYGDYEQEIYQEALEKANAEWEEFLDIKVAAETLELRQRQEFKLWQMQQKYEQREAAYRESMQNKRDARADNLEELLARGRARERERIQQAKDTQIRQKIGKLADRFDRMVTHQGKNNTAHVPVKLKDSIVEICRLFNMNQSGYRDQQSAQITARAEALTRRAQEQGVTNEIIEEAAKLGRLTDMNENAKKKLAAAAAEYAKLTENDVIYDASVAEHLETLRNLLDQKAIRDMTGNDLETVYDSMRSIMHTVVNANKAFSMGQDKTITGMASKWSGEVRQVNTQAQGMKVAAQRFAMWQMTPDVFFNYISGYIKNNEGKVIQKAFEQGTQRMLGVQQEYNQLFREITESQDKAVQKEMQKLLNPKEKEFVSIGMKDKAGNDVKVSRGMMLQIYMMLEQEDSRRSLVSSGFRLPNAEVYYSGKVDNAYGNMDETASLSEGMGEEYWDLVKQRKEIFEQMDELGEDITQEQKDEFFQQLKKLQDQAAPMLAAREVQMSEMFQRITGMLTPTEQKLIELAHKWYDRSGQMMRDVFLRMYGYEPKLVDNYVPIHRDPQSLVIDIRDPSQAQKAMNLENWGATKERVRSYKPILLTDFFVELEQQKMQMSRYVGFAEVQRDFNKIWKTDVGGTNMNSIIAKKFGQGKSGFGVSGEEWMNHYIADVAGGHHESSVLSNVYGNYAAATLRFNPRVAVSQMASIPTAASVIGWKACAVGFAKGIKEAGSKEYKNQLAAKNAWFWQRYRGEGGSTEIADIRAKGGMVEHLANSKVGKALFNWCQNFDVLSTGSIMWNMAEEAVKQKGMKASDEGFEAAVNQMYTDIIRKSQPNYTTTERSDLLRDQRGGMKLLTMFKTQSNQNLNLLIAANGEFIRMKQDFKNNRNGVTKADVDAAAKNLMNASTGVLLGGTVAFVLLRTIMNFVMGTVNPYRDKDTDEVTMKGTLAGMGKEMLSSLAGMVALGGNIYDFLMPIVTGDNYYGITDSAMEAISGLMENSVKVMQTAVDPDKSVTKKQIWNAANSWCMIMGIPAGNAKKIVDMAGMYTDNVVNGTWGQYKSDKTSNKQFANRIITHYLEGDTAKVDDALAMLWAKSSKGTDEEIKKDIVSKMREFLKDAYLVSDVTDLEAEKILEYCGDDKAAETVAKWDFELEQSDVNSNRISDELVAAYNGRGDIDAKTFMDAWWYNADAKAEKDENGKSIYGSKKQKVIDYILSIPGMTKEQQKRLFELIGAGEIKGTPWE